MVRFLCATLLACERGINRDTDILISYCGKQALLPWHHSHSIGIFKSIGNGGKKTTDCICIKCISRVHTQNYVKLFSIALLDHVGWLYFSGYFNLILSGILGGNHRLPQILLCHTIYPHIGNGNLAYMNIGINAYWHTQVLIEWR